jgi:hypothetical protein
LKIPNFQFAICKCLLALAALLALGLSAGAKAEEPSPKYLGRGTFFQALELMQLPETPPPMVLRLPAVEEELPPPAEDEGKKPEAEEVPAKAEASDPKEKSTDAPAQAKEPDSGEKVKGLVPIDLLPGPDDLLLKGEEALLAVEHSGYRKSWIFEPFRLWSASFEFGLNASAGNNEVLDLRGAAHVRRETKTLRFTGDVNYKTVSRKRKTITDRLFAEARNEWLLKESPWSFYLHGTAEYDLSRKFGLRLNTDTGISYQFYKTDIASLLGRFGGGVSAELRSKQKNPAPEAVFGADYERRLTKRQRLAASVDYFPQWDDFRKYRLNMRASWEINIDEEGALSLKLSLVDRYDSTPQGIFPNDIDYAATLLWSF